MIFFAVIDDKPKESIPEHDAQLSSIRWHLSEGKFPSPLLQDVKISISVKNSGYYNVYVVHFIFDIGL